MPGVGTESDYYAILGVARDAAPETIRKTYRRLMQSNRIHPDLGGDTRAAAEINKAYTVLSNAELRNDYDARLLILERVAQGFDVEAPAPVVHPVNACAFCAAPHSFSQHDDAPTADGSSHAEEISRSAAPGACAGRDSLGRLLPGQPGPVSSRTKA